MKLLIAFLFFILPIFLGAQIFHSDSLTTIAYWQQGESYKYQLDKYRLKRKDESVTESRSTSYITFDIQEETDSSYLIKMVIDSMKINGQFEDNPMMNALTSDISSKLSYLIETDENGSLLGIKNWNELKNSIVEMLSAMDFLSGMDDKQRKQTESALKVMTDSKEKIFSMFSKEFAVMFSNYGYTFDTRDTIEYNQLLPNPYGGGPFPQVGKVFFDASLVDSTGTVILYDQSSIDEEEGKKAIMHMLKQLSPDDSEEIEKEIGKIEFKVSDSTMQEFDTNSGAIVYATMERKVTTRDLNELNARTDRQTWRLLEVIQDERDKK